MRQVRIPGISAKEHLCHMSKAKGIDHGVGGNVGEIGIFFLFPSPLKKFKPREKKNQWENSHIEHGEEDRGHLSRRSARLDLLHQGLARFVRKGLPGEHFMNSPGQPPQGIAQVIEKESGVDSAADRLDIAWARPASSDIRVLSSALPISPASVPKADTVQFWKNKGSEGLIAKTPTDAAPLTANRERQARERVRPRAGGSSQHQPTRGCSSSLGSDQRPRNPRHYAHAAFSFRA